VEDGGSFAESFAVVAATVGVFEGFDNDPDAKMHAMPLASTIILIFVLTAYPRSESRSSASSTSPPPRMQVVCPLHDFNIWLAQPHTYRPQEITLLPARNDLCEPLLSTSTFDALTHLGIYEYPPL
jgi:hypothetical protein